MNRQQQERSLNRLLKNKKASRFFRYHDTELVIIFSDGSKLFADAKNGLLELSVTGIPESTMKLPSSKKRKKTLGIKTKRSR